MSLSYLCAMALVPILAVMLTITGGFGLQNYLTEYLMSTFGDNETINFVIERAGVFIDFAKSGWTGFICALTLVWVIIVMMFNIERCFDMIWKVDKARNFFKKISFYIVILLLSPFVVLIFFYAPIVHTSIFEFFGFNVEDYPILTSFGGSLITYVIVAFTMTAMYKYIPNADVRYHNAWRAAFPAAFVFCVFQYTYLQSQNMMTKWNVVYGALAAVPLFMVWLNISWQIILYGAEVSYALQTVDDYREIEKE